MQKELFLGNIDAKRDWGYAPDCVRAMWLMLQQEQPNDYVVATGECHSLREFLEEAFGLLELDWRDFVEFDPYCIRPTEVDVLVGDSGKARRVLGWEPEVTFRDVMRRMVECDLDLAKCEAHAAAYG